MVVMGRERRGEVGREERGKGGAWWYAAHTRCRGVEGEGWRAG